MSTTRPIQMTFLVLAAVAFLGGAPSAASAADCTVPSPTADQYCKPPPPSTDRGNDPSGGLPFTGYDVGLAALVATGLVGVGIGLSRAAKTDQAP